jgi:hypothetical protein
MKRASFVPAIVLLCSIVSFVSAAESVAGATMLFLTISPSAQVNGRSASLTAGDYEDPFATFYNPGAIGFATRQNRIAGGVSYMRLS